jgi:hypothetical protein
MKSSMREKKIVFASLCVGSIILVFGYVYWVKSRLSAAAASSAPSAKLVGPRYVKSVEPEPPAKETPQSKPLSQDEPPRQVEPLKELGRIFFRHNGLDANYGRVSLIGGDHRDEPRFAGSLRCEVLYVAGGRGICLTADRGVVTSYAAELFDARTFEKIGTIPLRGSPSRCRVSKDGRLAASTVFVTGHSYTSLNFSTQTLILDAQTATILADVESFSVTRDGQPFRNQDFNFWGVTFTPKGDQFYCTLSSQGKHYLIKGDIATQTATVLRDNVECPSLSPNGTRIAYKKRLQSGDRVVWQLHVLHLASGRDTSLDEERSVDDQLEWLDNERVLYALPASETTASASTNIWVAAANGNRAPELFLTNAYSPSIER